MAARGVKKDENVERAIEKATGCNPRIIEVWTLDLASFESVKAYTAKVMAQRSIRFIAYLASKKEKKSESQDIYIDDQTNTINVAIEPEE